MTPALNNDSEDALNTINMHPGPSLEPVPNLFRQEGALTSPIFITGIGTGIGKTLVGAIIVEALQADYWKPVQAGMDGTDNAQMKDLVSNPTTNFLDEVYRLKMPASPHIAAREEGVNINIDTIIKHYQSIPSKTLVIEGAGGIMVPLNEAGFVVDLIERLNAKVILVSRNYLGSINHSLLTAALCKQRNINVIGWVFNDQYLQYEDEIVNWSGYPKIASIPFTQNVSSTFVSEQAHIIRPALLNYL